MADHQQAIRPALQLLDQCLAVRTVEMVAGLVENQKIGVRENGSNQGDMHGLAAAEGARRRLGIQMP